MPITNIRNLKSKWWRDVNREWLIEAAYRCLVPFTAFAEPVRDSTWFSVPRVELAAFAGIWRLYSFLATEANEVVRSVHEKAMPVILIDPVEQAE